MLVPNVLCYQSLPFAAAAPNWYLAGQCRPSVYLAKGPFCCLKLLSHTSEFNRSRSLARPRNEEQLQIGPEQHDLFRSVVVLTKGALKNEATFDDA